MKPRPLAALVVLALGLLGIALAGSSSLAASGQHWVGSWETAPSDPSQTQTTLEDQTLRMIVAPHLGGQSIRVHLSNRFGTEAITLDQVDVGIEYKGPALVAGSNQPVLFGGSASVTVAAGQDVTSDPVALTIAPFQDVAVSVYAGDEIDDPTEHRLTRQTSYITPQGGGNHAGDEDGTAFTHTTAGKFSTGWYFLDGIDVEAPTNVGAVVTFGDSITDGYQGSKSPDIENRTAIDANGRYPDDLQRRIDAAGLPLSVLNAGIGGNRILKGGGNGGPSGVARLKRDALAQAGATDVIVLEGINDLGSSGATVNQVNAGLKRIVAAVHAAGLRVQLGTITPAEGTISKSGKYGSVKTNTIRMQINHWIRTQSYSDGVVDFDKAVRDPSHPGRIKPGYDGSDHLHFSLAGYRAMAAAVNLGLLEQR
jgi:lysophospholipase L1-like esterase